MKQIFLIAILISVCCFPSLSQTVESLCPQITPPNEILVPQKVALFTIVNGKEIYEYNWTVSSGTIIKGQGTSEIELILTPSDFGKNINVTLEINGLPKNCANKISETVSVISKVEVEPLSFYGKISSNDEKAQFDNLYHYISLNKDYEGVILLRFDKKTPLNRRIKRLKEVIKWIEFRKFDKSRISFAISENASEDTTVFLLKEKSEAYEDLVKDRELIKGEDLEQKLNKLFAKN